MFGLSLSKILISLVMAYVAWSAWSFYEIFYPKYCEEHKYCIYPYYKDTDVFTLEIHGQQSPHSTEKLIWRSMDVKLSDSFSETIKVTLPNYVRRNKSMIAQVNLIGRGGDMVTSSLTLTAFRKPKSSGYLLSGNDASAHPTAKPTDSSIPVVHWRSKLTVNVLKDRMVFDRRNFPPELISLMRLGSGGYLPMLYCNSLVFKEDDLVQVNLSQGATNEVDLHIDFQPISLGKLRLYSSLLAGTDTLKNMGFGEKDIQDVHGIFVHTNFYFLVLTLLVTSFHVLFDFLAFKNDVSFWNNAKTTAGLSRRTVMWRCFSSMVVCLYLVDQGSSLLVSVPAGIGMMIEFWKLTRVFKVRFSWSGIRFEEQTTDETETNAFDSQGMRYLAYVLVPLCCAGAVYSLLYVPHKSWFSWTVNSLANCVYAFGFLFMLPQLFINYKLKSVAHLPWKALTYKAFNTFIDDFFAFIITMPTAHRLACFRDDIVFIVYIYQRWLYPVDKSRVNEFGASYAEDSPKATTTQDGTSAKKDN